MATALRVETPVLDQESKFLGGSDLHSTDTHMQQAYSNFGSDTCQFIYDYSWYNYVVTTNPMAYTSSDQANAATAYFTYCQKLSSTGVTSCSGDYYASVFVNNVCTLQSSTVTMSAATPGNSQGATVALVYSNDDSTTNEGTSMLTVNQVCGTTPGTGELTDNGDGTYTTY